MHMSGNVMLITGGTSGIGRALAERFHAAGNTVIIAGRRQALLDEVTAAHPGMIGMTVDMSDAAAIDRLASEVMAAHPEVNILVNNAGIARVEDMTAHRDLRDAEEMIVTNLLGPIRLTNALVDHLSGRRGAAIVNVTSGLAFVPLVHTPTYNATKAAMHSYTMAQRAQLQGKVAVIELIPPGVQTDLTPGQATREGYLPLNDFIDEVMTLFAIEPTPVEIAVDLVVFLRRAEAEGRFDEAFALLNGGAG